MSDTPLTKAARALTSAKHAIAFTGAGISAESGIPTFRGSGEDSLWSRFKPEELATPEAFERNPRRVWEWYVWRMNLIRKAKPNPGHEALAKLEALNVIKAVVTQNVDGLHQRAGSRRVIELHGSIWRVKCSNPACTFRASISEPPKEIPPKCPSCGHYLRPDVVWFGEPLPQDAWGEAVRLAEVSDAILVVGTSGVVYPAAYIPLIVKERGGTVIEVNVAESSITRYANIFLKGRAGEVLPKLAEAVIKLIRQ